MSTVRRRPGLRAACLLLLAPLAPLCAAEGPLVLDHPQAARGDAAGTLEALLQALEADPRDPQVPLLLVELGQVWSWVPGGRAQARERIAKLVERLGDHWNRDELLGRLVDLALDGHDTAAAAKAQDARGFLREWLVVGGFGLRAEAALHDVHEPERAAAARLVDPLQRFATRKGEQPWAPTALRPLQIAVVPGSAAVDGAISYALTHVELPRGGAGYLVYTGPSARLWLNRVEVSTIDREADRLDGELRVPVRLAAGWNRILVKLAGGRGARFTLRVVDEEGAPISPAAYSRQQAVDAAPAEAVPAQSSWYMSRLALEHAARRQALYVWGLLSSGRGEEGLVLLEDLLAGRPELAQEAWLQVLLGDAAQRADHLPVAVRRDRAAQAYRAALALDPGHTRALRRLAEFAFQDEKHTEGMLLLERALAAHPDDLETRLRLVDALLSKGWLEDAERELALARERSPDLVPVVLAEARLLARREQVPAARQAEERLWRLDGSQSWTLTRALERAQEAGDAARVQAALERLLALDVWGPEDVARRRIEAARALGAREAELAGLRELVAVRPGDPEPRLALARRLVAEAEVAPAVREEAVGLLDEVLASAPGHHEARRLRLALRGEEGEGWWTEWEPDLERLQREAPGREHWSRSGTVCLFDQTVTRVWPDGSSEDVVHQVWKLLDDSGKEKLGSQQKLGRLLRVRTIAPDGQTLEPIGAGQTFEMPGLTPGALVEHAWRAERTPAAVQYSNGPFYFMDPDLSEPFWLSRWVVWVHRDAPIDLVERNLERRGISREVQERGEWRVHVYTARDQPRFERERGLPHRDELLPWLKVVERRSLEELSELHRATARADRWLGPTVVRAAHEVCEGAASDLQRLERLWRFVQEHVTQPRGGRTASQVLAARGGSKLVLLSALLEAVDIPVEWAVAAVADEQLDWEAGVAPVDWSHPDPDDLRVWLLRVHPRGADPVWLYPDTHRLAPWRALPPELSGATAYVCGQAGGTLEVLPLHEVTSEVPVTTTRLVLLPGGRAQVAVEQVIPSFGSYPLKERLASIPEQGLRQIFAGQANRLYPGARVLSRELPGLEEPGVPFGYRFTAEAEQVVRERGDGSLELKLPLAPANLSRTVGAYRQRLFDLVLKAGGGVRDLVEVDLGPYVCPRTPPSVALVTPEGQYSLQVSRHGHGLRIERLLLLRPGRVRAGDYARFREFLRQVDEAEQRALVLEEAGRQD